MSHPQNRFICPVLGSNSSRLTTLIAAMGTCGKKYLVVDGKALEDMVDDLEAVYGLKSWAKRTHGVIIAKRMSKEVRRIYAEEPVSNYVITATGTQDETYSSMNRALRDWLPPHRFSIEENDIIVPLQGPIPVGENYKLRKSARYFAEVFHGCRYILPEEIRKESDLILAGSGHASPADLKKFYSMIPCTVSYPVHGGGQQLEAGARLANESGLKSYIANSYEGYETLLNGNAHLLRREVGEMIGIRSKSPTPEQFYLRRNFTATVIPLKPRDQSPTGQALRQFEMAISKSIGKGVYNETAQNMEFSLSRTFNISSSTGYLMGRYAFGIERYGTDIYTAKHIGGYAAMDTETTGTDHYLDFIDQFSLAFWSRRRKLQLEVELIQNIPEYHTKNPEALMVTNTDPHLERHGDDPFYFSEKIQGVFKNVKELSKQGVMESTPEIFEKNPRVRTKTIVVAHNLKFDDRFIRKTLGENLSDRVRPHATDGSIAIDTRHLARALSAIKPNHFKVRKKPGSSFSDFTLKALCEENNIPYDETQAHHSALYDAHRAMHLFWKMEDIAPDLTAQMILNADLNTGHLLNDMMGMDTGFGGPYPVFSYLSSRADRPDLRLGSYIGVVGGGRYAVVVNMMRSIKDLLVSSPDVLIERLKDPQDDSLELIDLRNNPMIFPAKFFYQQKISRKFPRETIDRRAHNLKEHLNYVSPKSGWMNVAERLESKWKDNQKEILSSLAVAQDVDMKVPANQSLFKKTRTVSDYTLRNAAVRASATFNPVSQGVLKKIKAYREAALSYYKSGKDPETKVDVRACYRAARCCYGLSDEQAFLIDQIHYEIDQSDLDPQALNRLKGYQAYHAAHTTQRAKEVLGQSLSLEKLSDASHEKKSLLMRIKTYVADRVKTYRHNNLSRQFVHPWRSVTRDDDGLAFSSAGLG